MAVLKLTISYPLTNNSWRKPILTEMTTQTLRHIHQFLLTLTVPLHNAKILRKNHKDEKILWESGNIPKYQEKLVEKLKQVNQPVVNIDLAIQQVTQIIKQSVRAAFPVKTVKLKGPKLKISQTTLSLVKESKQILSA